MISGENCDARLLAGLSRCSMSELGGGDSRGGLTRRLGLLVEARVLAWEASSPRAGGARLCGGGHATHKRAPGTGVRAPRHQLDRGRLCRDGGGIPSVCHARPPSVLIPSAARAERSARRACNAR